MKKVKLIFQILLHISVIAIVLYVLYLNIQLSNAVTSFDDDRVFYLSAKVLSMTSIFIASMFAGYMFLLIQIPSAKANKEEKEKKDETENNKD